MLSHLLQKLLPVDAMDAPPVRDDFVGIACLAEADVVADANFAQEGAFWGGFDFYVGALAAETANLIVILLAGIV
jgi:hypothetical protein